MKPKKKLRRCRGLGLDSGLDLAISRFIYSLACEHLHHPAGLHGTLLCKDGHQPVGHREGWQEI